MEPIKKNKLKKILYDHITPIAQGVFSDESWRPIRDIWQILDGLQNKLGFDWNTTDAYYGAGKYDSTLPPENKTWKFEINFTNQNNRPDKIFGHILAAGMGRTDDPLEKYDLTVVMSESQGSIKTAKQKSNVLNILEEGGKSKGKSNQQYDQTQLEMGKKIEQEHVENNPNLTQKEKDEIAEKISRDHLEEAGDFEGNKGGKYYDLLEDLEKIIKKRLEKQ